MPWTLTMMRSRAALPQSHKTLRFERWVARAAHGVCSCALSPLDSLPCHDDAAI